MRTQSKQLFPKKRFGQHFLIDDQVIESIASIIDARATEHLLEIGPGTGVLTAPLVRTGAQLTAVELDRDLLQGLALKFASNANFRLLHGDALTIDLDVINDGRPLRIVGNLPYNISTPLIFHLLAQLDRINDIIVMLQIEVVQRLVAHPGTAAYGRLSIACQAQCEMQEVLIVEPDCFDPPPKVRSAVVRIVPLPVRPSSSVLAQLAIITRCAFSKRRKTLRHSLGTLMPEQALSDAGVSLMQRPEELSVAQYLNLSSALCQARRTDNRD